MPYGDPFRKLASGERLKSISGEAWNAFIETALAHRRSAFDGGSGERGSDPPEGLVLVRNDSGAGRNRFSVLGIDTIIIAPGDNLPEFQNNFAFSCITPAAEHVDKFVILWEPLADGKIGLAYAFGVCPVLLDVVDDAHQFAQAVVGSTAGLQSAASGVVQILYKAPAGSGAAWATVRFGAAPAGIFPVKVEVDGGADGDATAEATYTYTVRDLTGNILSVLVPLTRPRPIGSLKFQSGDDGFGVAFYDADGTIRLWDAGEVDADPDICELP